MERKETTKFSTPWANQIRRHYEAHASSQFILHGNIHDVFLLPDNTFGNLAEAVDLLTQSFDVLISYRMDRGIWVERGGNHIAKFINGGQEAGKVGKEHNPDVCLPELALILRQLTYRTRETKTRVAVVIHDAEKIAPSGQNGLNYELSHLVATLRSWANDEIYREYPLATFLITDTLQELHTQLVQNPRALSVSIGMPEDDTLEAALKIWKEKYSKALDGVDLKALARGLRGVTLNNVETEIKLAVRDGKILDVAHIGEIKKRIVEKEAGDLLEFMPPRRTLDDLAGMEPVKNLIRTYIHMWHNGQIARFPKGILASGPVGTGKTYLVDCVGGSIGFPTLKLKNFRDKWYGKTEANLERIFRALRALAPCVVFIDEADQTLGKRDNNANDGGLSGRIYARFAEEMSDPATRGKILWFFATSRPDLIEVDLKRPGRMDVKIALMPTGTKKESLTLLKALMRRDKFLDAAGMEAEVDLLIEELPLWLTPGAAEAICSEIYSGICEAEKDGKPTNPANELKRILKTYQPPVKAEVMEFQIRIAAAETTRVDLLPEEFRTYR